MIENSVVQTVALIALFALIAAITPCAWRVWRGPSLADRLLAADLISTLMIGVIILLVLITGDTLLVDIGIALAAFSFISTLAVARFLAEGRG